MLLAVDVGNTQTHLGLWRGAELAHTWRIATRPLRTTDDLAVQLDGLLALRDLDTSEVTALVVSATVPVLAAEWAGVGERTLAVDTLLIGPGVRTGMSILMDNPREVGPDRIVNAVAALARAGGPVHRGRLRHVDELRRRLGGRRVRRRRARARGRDLDGGALRARRAALERRVRRTADRDRAQHGACAAERGRLRLRRPGGRHRPPHARGAGRQSRASWRRAASPG